MKLSQFKLNLPEELIAQYPSDNRDESRLLVLNRKTKTIEHKVFKDIYDYFEEKDVLVLNDTKVFPARLYGNKEKTGAKIEVFLLRELSQDHRLWDVLVDPARKIRIGNKLYFGEDDSLVAEVIDNTTSRGRTLRFLFDGTHEEFKQTLFDLGETPLPKFIKRKPEEIDKDRFQTIYAKNEGAVAVPAAGLHFSPILLKKLELKGIEVAPITLHLGMGNFRTVEVEDLSKHKIDSESVSILQSSADTINRAKLSGHNVFACGTTVMRAMETSVSSEGFINPYEGWTNKFIFPPYDFSIANRMITNFHLPYSTLLMMVAAFSGYELLMDTYNKAIKEGYKFGIYGDAMLII
jgi:S-adenosylmethionine:tRNA ribosyltransferase-isomerase